MKNVAKIFGLILFLYSGSVSANDNETYLESNHEDVKCEWTSPAGSGKDICHIIMQGTHMGETMQAFRIGNRPEIFAISDTEKPTISLEVSPNKMWKVIWKGELLLDNFRPTYGTHAIETIKLSNGYTIKMYR